MGLAPTPWEAVLIVRDDDATRGTSGLAPTPWEAVLIVRDDNATRGISGLAPTPRGAVLVAVGGLESMGFRRWPMSVLLRCLQFVR